MLAHTKKAGLLSYLSKYKESLLFASAEVEGGHGISLESNTLSDQLESALKPVEFWRGDNNINKILSLKYCREVIKCMNERENEHERKIRKLQIGLVKV